MVSIPMISASESNEEQQPQPEPLWRQTFDPRSRIMIYWNRFLFVIAMFNVGLDLLLWFVIRIDNDSIAIDFRLISHIQTLKFMADSCQFLGIIVKFRTAIVNPVMGVFRKQGLIRDSKIIAKQYLKSRFIFDFFATLPLMQVYFWCKLPPLKTFSTRHFIRKFYGNMVLISGIQGPPKVYILFPWRKKLIGTGDIIMRPAWTGALYFLLFYILLSQLTGACYYYSYIMFLLSCKAKVPENQASVITRWDDMLRECAIIDQVEQGMFVDIYKNRIGSRSFLQRFMYCFSWGLKCLSSMGQNFVTSATVEETIFSFITTIFGLVLFAGLIAQMQTCIQSMEPGEEQQIVRQRYVDEWARNHQIPPELKQRLRQTVVSDLRALRGLDDDSMLGLLPLDLQYDIRRHLYSDRAYNLPFFVNLDRELAQSFIGHLRTISCCKDTYVVIEGEPVKLLLLIFSGKLEMSSVNGGSSDTTLLGAGDLCGSELLTWASFPSASNQNLPCSCQSVKCLTDVEAFSLFAEDLKLLGNQFNYCWKFQQALR